MPVARLPIEQRLIDRGCERSLDVGLPFGQGEHGRSRSPRSAETAVAPQDDDAANHGERMIGRVGQAQGADHVEDGAAPRAIVPKLLLNDASHHVTRDG